MLHGQTRYSLPSRFLDEIPEGLLKWLTPRFAGARAREARAVGVHALRRPALVGEDVLEALGRDVGAGTEDATLSAREGNLSGS